MIHHIITFLALTLLILFLFLGYYQFKTAADFADVVDSILHAGMVLLLWNYLMSRA